MPKFCLAALAILLFAAGPACSSASMLPPATPASQPPASRLEADTRAPTVARPVGTAIRGETPPATGLTLPSAAPAAAVTAAPTQPPTTPTVSPSPTATRRDVVELPLSHLSPEAQNFVEGRDGRLGVAVYVPGQGALYTANGDQLMSMASVVKVAIMLTVLDRAADERRDVSARELAQLRPMITESDNDATTSLWEQVGGAAGVEGFLLSIGIADIVPNASDYWGASRASAKAVALLFAQIAFGDILDPPRRQLAIDLLSDVVPSQRWGVTAGVPNELPPGTVIGLKDGWYPAGYGWWVNSAGMLIPGDERPAYTIAVLTRGQPSWEYGIASIEGAAERVHTALHGPH